MRSTMPLSLFSCPAAAALLCLSAAAHAAPAVVELFTSEGCSSCPPAEAYIGELTQRGDVLALTFHVDYWDDLGWRDRFALPSAVQRQRAYAKNLGLSSVYTPQVIIDGHQNFVGSDRFSIGKALARPRNGAAIDLSLQQGELRIGLPRSRVSRRARYCSSPISARLSRLSHAVKMRDAHSGNSTWCGSFELLAGGRG